MVVLVSVIWLIRGRRSEATAAANPIVLCPGPDAYGYTCTSGAGYAYLDATNDTFLYEDDGIIPLQLPFTFTFYGTEYDQVNASSNGNLQFTTQNSTYENFCVELPVPEATEEASGDGNTTNNEDTFTGATVFDMGDLIAPYWTDLDLRFYGYLETEIFGEAPNRIFVIEWDNIPPYDGLPEDGVTFAVQLFEGSNDIVFLYQDVTSLDSNGIVSTVLLQSEQQELALQYSCNQATIADLSGIHFPHPDEVEGGWGIETEEEAAEANVTRATMKADAAALLQTLNLSGHPETRLGELQQQWVNQNPARLSQWLWVDLTGDGLDDLVLLWRERPQLEQSRLLLLTRSAEGEFSLFYDVTLSSRDTQFEQLVLVAVGDVTGEGLPDVLLHDEGTGQSRVFTLARNEASVHVLAEKCTGRSGIVAGNVVRDGCGRGRVISTWNGLTFSESQP